LTQEAKSPCLSEHDFSALDPTLNSTTARRTSFFFHSVSVHESLFALFFALPVADRATHHHMHTKHTNSPNTDSLLTRNDAPPRR
jgi:hypothetical protein